MKILLYEHVSGGGFAGQSIPSSLLSEGYAMLRGLTADFKAAGHTVTILIDSRLVPLTGPLGADNIIQVTSDATQSLVEAAKTAEAAFIIAPESDNILQSIVKHLEDLGIISLNCQSTAIEQAIDKASLPERLERLGLHAPKTYLFKADAINEIKQVIDSKLGYPAVIKPVNGAGCSSLSMISTEEQITAAISKIHADTPSGQVLVQKFIEGIPASVSLLSTGNNAAPISLNLQNITLASPDSESCYNGGIVPLDTHLKAEALAVAKRVVESFSGLRGYIGVDLVLAEDKVYVIEVNPRLTTSYVGLRKVANNNIAQAIIDSVIKKQLPQNLRCKGYSYFSKVPISSSSPALCKESFRIPEVVTPPFPVMNNEVTYALLESYAESLDVALVGFSEAKNRLKRICEGE